MSNRDELEPILLDVVLIAPPLFLKFLDLSLDLLSLPFLTLLESLFFLLLLFEGNLCAVLTRNVTTCLKAFSNDLVSLFIYL